MIPAKFQVDLLNKKEVKEETISFDVTVRIHNQLKDFEKKLDSELWLNLEFTCNKNRSQ